MLLPWTVGSSQHNQIIQKLQIIFWNWYGLTREIIGFLTQHDLDQMHAFVFQFLSC